MPIKSFNSPKLGAFIIILFMMFTIIPFDASFALSPGTASLANGGKVELNLDHTRADQTAFYNGERVKLDICFTGGNIAADQSYTIDLPNTTDGSEYAFLLNTAASTDIMVNSAKVGAAVYDAATGKLKITFSDAVSAADTAKISIPTNVAVKESDETGQQTLDFAIDDNGTSVSSNVTIDTTSKGFVSTVAFSRVNNVVNHSNVSVTTDWKALGGLGAGDYFEVAIPITEDEVSKLSVDFMSTLPLPLEKNGVIYGTASVEKMVNKDGVTTGVKIVFNFTQGSTDTNISGTATYNGNYTFEMKDKVATRPTTSTIITYVNGEPVEFPITIGAPGDLSKYDQYVNKTLGAATALIRRDQPVPEGTPFYRFSWRARANWAGLPGVGEFPEGENMHNVVMTDTVEGPGHYIDMSYFRVWAITDTDGTQPTYGLIKDLPILGGQLPSASTRQYLDLSAFLSYAAAAGHPDILQTVPYGDGDPNHVTSFTLKVGDLEKVALELEYRSYIQEGSTAEIPSFRDYFYQSLMNTQHVSTIYKNSFVLDSVEHDIIHEPVRTVQTDGSASMTSGNMNLKLVKVDQSGTPQKGVDFTLFWNGGQQKKTTDDSGIIEFNGLGTGAYVLTETKALADYKAAESIGFTVPATVPAKYEDGDIDLTDKATFASFTTTNAGMADYEGDFDETSGKVTGSNKITNRLIEEGGFTVTKVDEDDSTKILNDAQFILAREIGEETDYYALDGNDEITWVADKDDAQVLTTKTDGTFTVENLPYGDYKLIETAAPNDYQLDQTPIAITIDKDHRLVTKTVTNKHNPIIITEPPAENPTSTEPSTVTNTMPSTDTTVTTTPTVNQESDDEPSTGDSSNMVIWFILLGISLVSIVVIRKRTVANKK